MQIDELEAIKDVEVSGKSYMIAHMDSDVGSWLLMRLMGELTKIVFNVEAEEAEVENKDAEKGDAAKSAITLLLMNLDQATFKIVQRHALNVCYRYENVGGIPKPMPVILSNGKLCYKDLNHDIKSVLELTSEALLANLSPFFSKDGLQTMFAGKQDSPQLNFQT